MKKLLLPLLCLLLAAAVLSGCGGKTMVAPLPAPTAPAAQTPVAVPATPDAYPTAAPTALPFPTPVSIPSPAATAMPFPTAAPTPVYTPAPTPVYTAAPVYTPAPVYNTQSNLPRITKNPTDETVNVNGWCQFVTRYENAELAEWHFVNANGIDASYLDVQKQLPTLTIIGGNTKDMTLENIPAALNGCRVYCRFSNRWGSTDSGSALITVLNRQQYYTPTPAREPGYAGRWAEEIAGRCQITFTTRSDGDLNVDISWSGSAWQRSRWQMTATERWGVMYYDDGHSWVETYNDTGSSYSISNESYNGTGSFYIQDGKLHWYNDQTGEETLFLRA